MEVSYAFIILWSHWQIRLSSALELSENTSYASRSTNKAIICSVWVKVNSVIEQSHQTNVPGQSKPCDPEGRPAESLLLDVQRRLCRVCRNDFQGFQYDWVGSSIRFQCWDSFIVVQVSQINAIYAQKYISCWLSKIGLLQTFCYEAHFCLRVSGGTLFQPHFSVQVQLSLINPNQTVPKG